MFHTQWNIGTVEQDPEGAISNHHTKAPGETHMKGLISNHLINSNPNSISKDLSQFMKTAIASHNHKPIPDNMSMSLTP
jgi:hypothetical protein